MHQSIETPTPWVPGKGRGFDSDPSQKASISLPPKARSSDQKPLPLRQERWKDQNFQRKDMYLNRESFQVYMYKYAALIKLLVLSETIGMSRCCVNLLCQLRCKYA